MFEDGGYIEEKSKCQDSINEISCDYELNNGEKYFYIPEIEVYQIFFQ